VPAPPSDFFTKQITYSESAKRVLGLCLLYFAQKGFWKKIKLLNWAASELAQNNPTLVCGESERKRLRVFLFLAEKNFFHDLKEL
jgi:hypothetical protein